MLLKRNDEIVCSSNKTKNNTYGYYFSINTFNQYVTTNDILVFMNHLPKYKFILLLYQIFKYFFNYVLILLSTNDIFYRYVYNSF